MKKLKTVMLIAAAMATMAGCNSKPTVINASSLMNVSFSGYEGFSAVQIEDTETLTQLASAESIQSFLEESTPGINIEHIDTEGLGALLDFTPNVDCSKLKNGTQITIAIQPVAELQNAGVTLETIENEFGFQLDKTEINIAANNLTKTKTVDVANVVADYINYSGSNGTCRPQVNFPQEGVNIEFEDFTLTSHTTNMLQVVSNNTVVGQIAYKIDPVYTNLQTGDKFDVILEFRGDVLSFMQNKGIMPIDAVVMTVPELTSYIDTAEKISEELKTELMQYHTEEVAAQGITKTSTAKMFVGAIKPEMALAEDPTGRIVIISGAEYGGKPGITMTVAAVKIEPDGTSSVEKYNRSYAYAISDPGFHFDMMKPLDEQYTDDVLLDALNTQYNGYTWSLVS